MAGQPTPPIIVEAFALNAPTCTPAAPVAGGKTAPFPSASQIAVTPGAASLNDGFPPLTMTLESIGGVPPFGVDMNGILYVLSAWAAFLGAGQLPQYSATLQTAMTGYAQGAVLAKAAAPWQTWTSIVSGNVTDPDTGGAGWVSSTPLYSSAALSGSNNVVLPGPSDYVIDVDTTAGPKSYTGFVAQRDGQKITFRNVGTGTNLLTLQALNGGSSAANQIFGSADISAVLHDSITIQYSSGAGQWNFV